MPSTPLACPDCRHETPASLLNTGGLVVCPHCECEMQIEVFPAFYKPVTAGAFGERIVADGEAGCFFHPEKKAVLPCGVCGRFLCALCDIEMNGRHICPTCMETGREKGDLVPHLETRRTLYDGIALALALVPLLVWPFTLVTAPAALVMAIYSFRKPTGLTRRSHRAAWFAILFSLVEMAAWAYVGWRYFGSRF